MKPDFKIKPIRITECFYLLAEASGVREGAEGKTEKESRRLPAECRARCGAFWGSIPEL